MEVGAKRPRPCVSVLLTQSIQNDYLTEAGASSVFVGPAESRRVLAPLRQFVERARGTGSVRVIHVRDWHVEKRDAAHLKRFGPHCLAGTRGAQLVVGEEEGEECVDAGGLNDVLDTDVMSRIAAAGARPGEGCRVAVVGCWTDAKVSFLLYDLKTRGYDVATSSALTASNSLDAHIDALARLRSLLGVPVFDGVSDLLAWLCFSEADNEAAAVAELPAVVMEEGAGPLEGEEERLVKAVFDRCSSVRLRMLAGGYSGAKVFCARSMSIEGSPEFPTLLKMGKRDSILRERLHSLAVEKVLGSNAPRVLAFHDGAAKAVVLFSFAALVGSGEGDDELPRVQSLEQAYRGSSDVSRAVGLLCGGLLHRLYTGAKLLPFDIFGKDQYDFDGRGWSWAAGGTDNVDRIRERIEVLLPGQSNNDVLHFPGGRSVPNLCTFMECRLPDIVRRHAADYHLVATVHGDCHFRNVLLDENQNVFLVDFEYSATGPLLKDYLKLEADLLYVHTVLNNDETMGQALDLSDALAAVDDLRKQLPSELSFAAVAKCWTTLCVVRRCMARTLSKVHPHAGRSTADLAWAKLRYALHAMTFSYLGDRQKLWALYDACLMCRDLDARKRYRTTGYPMYQFAPNLYVSYCPGRIDRSSPLARDIETIAAAGVVLAIGVITEIELLDWAQESSASLAALMRAVGVELLCCPVQHLDAPSAEVLHSLTLRVVGVAAEGGGVLIFSLSGLGRSGTVAACILKHMGAEREELQRARGDRRVLESDKQVQSVESFA